MGWIEFTARTEEIKQAITSHLHSRQSQVNPESYYNNNKLGLLGDSSIKEFLNVEVTLKDSAPTEKTSDEIGQPAYLELEEDELYSVKTLRWLQQNGNSPEDRKLAKRQYRRIVFELWRKRMARTGETWYPPLRDDLWERYRLMANDPDFM